VNASGNYFRYAKKGGSLGLPGFGTFEVRERAARTGRNPKTGEELKIPASRVAAFKPGAALKAPRFSTFVSGMPERAHACVKLGMPLS
jgi:hypothetical protein